MEDVLQQIALCVEKGKINISSPYPPDLKGKNGADEWTKAALEQGISAQDILEKGLIAGMNNIGVKFREDKVFVPDVLMAAKTMQTAMKHIKPFFQSGEVKRKGVFIIGTVAGDLHDIGKNLVAMIIEGAGWEVIDLGTDVPAGRFIDSIKTKPGAIIGLSALLTTTMLNMEETVKKIKAAFATARVIVGGAPVNLDFARKIGADAYAADPQAAVEYLGRLNC